MDTQAILNLRTVKDAYRVFCAKDPDTGTPVSEIRIDALVSALHFLEVSACATHRAYDPTVPEHAKLQEFGRELVERSGMASQFSMDPLEVSDPEWLQDCCSEAIADAVPLLLPLTASRNAVASDTFHSPLRIEAPAATVASWRACFTSTDVAQIRGELAAKVFYGDTTFYGAKCIIGVLGNPGLTIQVADLIAGADDSFLLDHVIPAMIERFRLHFLPTLAAKQPRTTVPFFDPRLVGLCEAHAEYVGTFLAREARGTQPERSHADQFRLAFDAVPLALLALLTLPDNLRRPNSKRVFERVLDLREQVDRALGPRQFVAGQLHNELDGVSRKILDEWVQSLLPASLPIEPLYCRAVKYGVPLVFTAASCLVGTVGGGPGVAGGLVFGIAAGTPAGYWLSEAINPHRRYNVALRSYGEIQGNWQRLDAANSLSGLIRAKVKSQLGLKLA